MKRKISLLLAVLMLAGVMVGCGTTAVDDQTGEDTSWQYIEDKGTIVLGLDDEFPPMGFRDEATNELVGYDLDMAKLVAEELGVEVIFQPISWDAKEAELNTKKIDIIWNGFSISDDRLLTFNFSTPYLKNRQAVVVLEDTAIATKEDLAGKTIGVQGGSNAKEAVEGDEAVASIIAGLQEYDTIPLALLDLKSGRVDAVVADEVVVRYLTSLEDQAYKFLGYDFGVESYAVGMRKGEDAFTEKFNEALATVMAGDEAKAVAEKWGLTDMLYE